MITVRTRTRSQRIVTNVEQQVFDLVGVVSKAESLTMSEYIRRLLLRDLLKRGQLTAEMVARMILGGDPDEE